jgi:hypothetical protein
MGLRQGGVETVKLAVLVCYKYRRWSERTWEF